MDGYIRKCVLVGFLFEKRLQRDGVELQGLRLIAAERLLAKSLPKRGAH